MLLHRLIAICSASLGEARSDSAVYHLLSGRKSIQTVQDSHLYNLNNYYGIYKALKKTDFDDCIEFLLKENVLNRIEDTITIPGPRYSLWVSDNNTNNPDYLKYFNGQRYCTVSHVFWERLILLIQTLTNSAHNHLEFIPVTDNDVATAWVRKTYKTVKNKEAACLKLLHNELSQLLQNLGPHEAGMIVDSFTGYKQYGMSSFQLADKYNFSRIDFPLVMTAVIHRVLRMVELKSEDYPYISRLLDDLPADSRITNSARRTKELLLKGYSLKKIKELRKLKMNTIYDHLVEIALYDKNFPVTDYVSEQHRKQISTVIQQVKTNKLKDIKARVSPDISYFEIRLVLAADNLASEGKPDE